jgi:D-xylose reductase
MSSLNNIPPVGFGLWKVAQEDCAQTVYQAIKAGYRHLDCASDYGNEEQVGDGIA